MPDAQTSMKILQEIAKCVSTFPALESEIHEIENQIKSTRK
jgi:hypothetical protein